MLDKLELFIVLAREGHFGRAAVECGISQPSLSAAIRQLEDQLGVVLVVRGTRYQGLTPEGQRVLEWAKRIVGDARTMREEMRAAKSGLSGHIRLAAIPTALAMIPRLTEPFQAKHPDVTFSVVSRTSLQVLSQLDNFEIDAGITYLDNEPLGRVTSVPLYAERYTLVTAEGTLYSDRDTVTWHEMENVRLCLLTPDMQNRRIINQHLEQAGVTVEPTLESNSMVVLLSHVSTGQWASIMPRNVAHSFGFAKEIRMIPIVEPEASHLVGLVATHREPFTPLVSALLHQARNLSADDLD
ncbi:LysR family transcriptional regulator [Pseudorhizobium flavum]|jgi:DNA-binding transcriptional LysR family regulator|uniref:HTH-type transcriptional regulator TtuA n=1 Tax=Pseudorhizobium flavum TaxID=1335061 RepID=A0A7W9YXC5_9HYPH|nr:LysR family transcriptional regulator [Pseudorhizobium flavum]MBB6180099.1 DNA-binding transcriptional LysR family regulator [Pseudorhizobium flavum]CAD6598511.1 LysR family transcriptional regulator [Rhizobium sp. TCK]CAD6617351.1 LysR family transcriptional regulator [Pseudorhizobium flavum]